MNSWLGGFQSILKRMTPGNFDWFLHAMLYYHTKHVLKKASQKRGRTADRNVDEDENEGVGMDADADYMIGVNIDFI